MEDIKGYDYGKATVGKSPVSMEDLDLLKKTLLWSDDDDRHLRMAGEILKDQTDDVTDLWYSFVGSNDHLLHYFTKDGAANTDYLTAVKARFGQWILDTCNRTYDQDWLNYQHEMALRHHTAKKNKTDGVDAEPIVHYRYMVAFIVPLTVTIRGFLAKKGHDEAAVEGMYSAWFKALTLTSIVLTHPYINAGEF